MSFKICFFSFEKCSLCFLCHSKIGISFSKLFPVVLFGKVSASNDYPQHMGLDTRENLPLWVCEQQMPDQPVHPCSLISAFVIYLLESHITILATSKIF